MAPLTRAATSSPRDEPEGAGTKFAEANRVTTNGTLPARYRRLHERIPSELR